MSGRFIYKDDYIAVYSKVSGEDSQKIAEENGLFVIERLDKPVVGLLVFACDSKTAGKLNEQLSSRDIDKTYYAVISGEIDDEGSMSDLLFHDKRSNKTFVVKRERKGVKLAKLNYSKVSTYQADGINYSLVRIKLETGRTHQIRIQFASRKLPLVGDGKYGSRIKGQPALFAQKLELTHPKSGERLSFVADIPEGMPWSLFEAGVFR